MIQYVSPWPAPWPSRPMGIRPYLEHFRVFMWTVASTTKPSRHSGPWNPVFLFSRKLDVYDWAPFTTFRFNCLQGSVKEFYKKRVRKIDFNYCLGTLKNYQRLLDRYNRQGLVLLTLAEETIGARGLRGVETLPKKIVGPKTTMCSTLILYFGWLAHITKNAVLPIEWPTKRICW